jgi:cyanophycinase
MDRAAEGLSAFYRIAGRDSTRISKGLNLVPDAVIETRYDASIAGRDGLVSVLARHPRSVGIVIEKNTAVVLDGRKMRVLGEGTATFLLRANERQPLRVQTLSSQAGRRRASAETLIDLTQWRREAIDRTLHPFPPATPEKPFVAQGTLIIVGGGGMPSGLMAQFVELAGGPEEARLVYVPCSERDVVSARQRTVQSWKEMGVRHAAFIHTKDRNRANNDETILAPLREATGIWFGGGRQWNFADSYYGTEAHRLMKEVLKRGGVVGGSSAGASIQARFLARATPIGNHRIMAPGYERGGLGFISGVAIDQHFSQRQRQKDMSALVNRYPQLLGIGIDEGTALIVQKSIAQVVGRGQVYFYDRQQPLHPDRPDYISLPGGSSFDLAARRAVKDSQVKENVEP